MSFITGFQIRRRIYESAQSLVFQAVRESDGTPVAIKILKSDYPSATELARYRREFETTHKLNLPGVIQSLELQRHEKTLLIVFEDFGGMSVAELLRERKLSLDEFLDTAIQVTESLGHVHRARIIHKDISPANLVLNPGTGEAKIIDFGLSTRFATEHPVLKSAEVLEGTVAYMSPEQTGRMNRSLDYRSDFYSLGATFYEMLTGRRPFDAEDMIALVHCHIAREPVPPHRVNADVPLALSKIVSKLMAKKAEDRYQSAAGILADLETVRGRGNLDRFEPGRLDHSAKFQIPERLYGREDEVSRLLEAFERTRRGPAELMLVAGYSGVGKSALIHEVHKPITKARGYFISGKFDQLQRNVPYSGLVAAFRDLVRQLVTESPERLAGWKRSINEAVAPNGHVLLDVVPDLALVIGPQPAVPELGPAEAANRFNRSMGRLLRALCAKDNVIVLFLDDLQWADSATLQLLRVVLTDDGIQRLFMIGAYRDNEVDAMHPLTLALRAVRDGGGTVNTLTLAPLGMAAVAKLLGDALLSDSAEVTALARLVVQKTQGNPLFVRQFLLTLHEQGLVKQAPPIRGERPRWAWDLRAVRAADITDNVVDLLLAKLKRLSPETQDALRLAACIGNRFDLDTLALIQKTTPDVTFEALRPAIEEALVRPLSDLEASDTNDLLSPLVVQDFAFQHDRVQQAAYSLIADGSQRDIHLAIGRRLLATLPAEALRDRIFEVADHVNLGRGLVTDPQERQRLASLNLEAARKATDATAYAAALNYARAAQGLLGDEGWQQSYTLTLNAWRKRASLEYLSGNFERSSEIVATTLEHARTRLEKAEVYFTRIEQNTLLMRFGDALEAGRQALALLGVELPLDQAEAAGQQALGRAMQLLAGRMPADLDGLPDVSSPEMALAQRCLRHMTITAFLSDQTLFPLIIGTSVGITLEHGHAPESALSFANLGLIMGAFMGQYHAGHEFGKLAMRLCDRFQGRAPSATVCLVIGSEVMPWVQHARASIPVFERGYQAGLDSGDILWAGYLVMYRVLFDAYTGQRIDDVLDALPDQLGFTARTQNHGAAAGILAHQIVLSTLAGRTKSSSDFSAAGVDEATFLRQCHANQIAMAICFYKILKAQALYLFGLPREALQATRDVEGMLAYIVIHPTLADHVLYQSLSMAALWDGTRGEQRIEALAKLQANAAQLKIWADHCPANYLAKQLMVDAEIARITGEGAGQERAADLFDAAINAAHEGQYVQDEALANELAARHIMETRPRSRVGSMYLRDARYAYLIWGANRKVEELELEFPQLLTEYREARSAPEPLPSGTVDAQTTTTGSSTRRTGAARLDLDTLIKAGQTISGEVMLSRLLDRLLAIVIENAGAQRGVLVLARDGELLIQAEGSVTSDEISVLMSVPLDSANGAAMVPISVIRSAARTLQPVVIDDAQRDERFAADLYVQKRETRSVLCQPIVNQGQLTGLVYVENDLLSGAFTPERCRLLALLSGQIAVSLRNAELVERLEEKVRERTEQLELRSRFIEQTFGRYLSNEIADNLLRSAEALDFGGSKRSVTIMMSDLRGFSALSDRLPPESIVKLLNNYLSEMTAAIQKHNGTIDEFLGDAILTIFGAPLQRPDDPDRAVACAVDMQMAMTRVNAWNAEQGFPQLEMGIGINTGEVVVGNIGSRKRAKYGVVGSNVNLAGRIEGFATGGQILISEATRLAVKTPLLLRSEMRAEPKGSSLPTTLHEVGGLGGSYNLNLPERRARWVAVAPEWPITFRWLSHKEVVGQVHEASLLLVSEGEAELRSATPPPAFTDVKLAFLSAGGEALGEAYAKVTTRPPRAGGFVVRFTMLSPAVQQALQALLNPAI
jgi:predicted ATPase/class 3 adenylate cyclase/tRNA A-37 threonylcarbamoyl transferase component Bud32